VRCDYCGRTNCDDGHGGCFACGAPVKQARPAYVNHSYEDATCAFSTVALNRAEYTVISRKKVTIG
jgi:hypothetical protein